MCPTFLLFFFWHVRVCLNLQTSAALENITSNVMRLFHTATGSMPQAAMGGMGMGGTGDMGDTGANHHSAPGVVGSQAHAQLPHAFHDHTTRS